MTLLNTYNTQEEAIIDGGMLEANGIKCKIVATALQSMFPAPDAGQQEFALYVDDRQSEEALRLLREHHDI